MRGYICTGALFALALVLLLGWPLATWFGVRPLWSVMAAAPFAIIAWFAGDP